MRLKRSHREKLLHPEVVFVNHGGLRENLNSLFVCGLCSEVHGGRPVLHQYVRVFAGKTAETHSLFIRISRSLPVRALRKSAPVEHPGTFILGMRFKKGLEFSRARRAVVKPERAVGTHDAALLHRVKQINGSCGSEPLIKPQYRHRHQHAHGKRRRNGSAFASERSAAGLRNILQRTAPDVLDACLVAGLIEKPRIKIGLEALHLLRQKDA